MLQDGNKILASLQNGAQLSCLLKETQRGTILDQTQFAERGIHQELLSALTAANLLQRDSEGKWIFSGYAKVQVAIRALQLGEPARMILESLTWQEFEEFVAFVFNFHDFQVQQRFRFSTNRKFEIDIIAKRPSIIFCIDCKQYGVRLGKASSLRNASEEQLRRTLALANSFSQFQADLGCLDWSQAKLVPMLVTMLHEDIQYHAKIPIVPASLLNAFLLGYEKHLDTIRVIPSKPQRQLRLI